MNATIWNIFTNRHMCFNILDVIKHSRGTLFRFRRTRWVEQQKRRSIPKQYINSQINKTSFSGTNIWWITITKHKSPLTYISQSTNSNVPYPKRSFPYQQTWSTKSKFQNQSKNIPHQPSQSSQEPFSLNQQLLSRWQPKNSSHGMVKVLCGATFDFADNKRTKHFFLAKTFQ